MTCALLCPSWVPFIPSPSVCFSDLSYMLLGVVLAEFVSIFLWRMHFSSKVYVCSVVCECAMTIIYSFNKY